MWKMSVHMWSVSIGCGIEFLGLLNPIQLHRHLIDG